MSVLETLLELQAHDTAIDRLQHRRAAMPERVALREAAKSLEETEAVLGEVRSRRDDLLSQERRLDEESTALEAKAVAVDKKMYSGEVGSPRELQSMQADIDQLRQHRSQVDDRELEIIEQREMLDAEVALHEATRASQLAEVTRLGAVIGAAETEIDAELDVQSSARAALATSLDPQALATYERCRAQARGIGAARLIGDTCQGCHLSTPATEVERIRRLPADTFGFCDNCGAILVTT